MSPLFADGPAFGALIDTLAERCTLEYETIAAVDALGFVLGAALAQRVRCGLILVRKAGAAPVPSLQERFVDYTGADKGLEVRRISH